MGIDADPAGLENRKAAPIEHWSMAEEQARLRTAEINVRVANALHDAGRSALGMPSSVDTLKAMLAKVGLALVLAPMPGRRA
jgi:hypothetical protein